MNQTVYTEPTATNVAELFAKRWADLGKDKSSVHIALSGGSTPKLLFRLLAEQYKDLVPWEKLHLWWGDERCVPPDHDESNYKMTKELLISQVPILEQNVHRILGESLPEDEAKRYGAEIMKHVPIVDGLPRFDLIILGMGTDGHTASIFPHEMELMMAPEICAVAIHPDSGQNRVSLTGPVINHAKEIAFLVTGENKAQKIKEIFEKTHSSQAYPAAHIHPVNGQLFWYLDEAAAAIIT